MYVDIYILLGLNMPLRIVKLRSVFEFMASRDLKKKWKGCQSVAFMTVIMIRTVNIE